MASFNRVLLLGNLIRDPELKFTPKGTAIADIGLAVNRTYTEDNGEKREECVFVDVTLWGRVAEIVGEYCKKGTPLFVEGRLQLDTWDDKQSGQKRNKLKVIGENIQLLGGKKDSDALPTQGHPQGQHGPAHPPQRSGPPQWQSPQRPAGRTPAPRDPDLDPPSDDIPF